MNEVEIFKPGIAELRSMAERFQGIEIKGVDDAEGYKTAKEARKELGDMRISITKTGKAAREEARRYAAKVIEQEKEYLAVITPTEDALKAKIEAIDEEKKKNERMILLPARKTMLEEIECQMTDEDILALDEKQFSDLYTAKKMAHLEEKERIRKAEEDKKRHEEELEQARKEAAEKATKEAEERMKREQEEKERKAKEEEEQKKREEEEKIANEKAEQERTEKNRKYKAWLKKNGYTEETKNDFSIARNGNTFVLFKKIDEITIA